MRNLRKSAGKENEAGDTKRDTILEHARRLFSVLGIRKTTVDDIAKNARVAKGTIYNYYPGKEAIFSQLVKREGDAILKKIRESVAQADTARGKLKNLVITKIKCFKEAVVFYKVEQETIDLVIPEIMDIRNDFYVAEKKMIMEFLELGVKSGELKKADFFDNLSHIIIIALKELARPWVIEKEMAEVEVLAGQLVDILFDGIAVK
jgi:AcrR family transcriptional regulator